MLASNTVCPNCEQTGGRCRCVTRDSDNAALNVDGDGGPVPAERQCSCSYDEPSSVSYECGVCREERLCTRDTQGWTGGIASSDGLASGD